MRKGLYLLVVLEVRVHRGRESVAEHSSSHYGGREAEKGKSHPAGFPLAPFDDFF